MKLVRVLHRLPVFMLRAAQINKLKPFPNDLLLFPTSNCLWLENNYTNLYCLYFDQPLWFLCLSHMHTYTSHCEPSFCFSVYCREHTLISRVFINAVLLGLCPASSISSSYSVQSTARHRNWNYFCYLEHHAAIDYTLRKIPRNKYKFQNVF